MRTDMPYAGLKSVVISAERDIRWLRMPNELTVVLGDALPPSRLITGALALVLAMKGK